MIGIEYKKKNHYFFHVEIGSPSANSVYKVENDYMEVMKVMKESINNQLRIGIDNPSSLGLLIEGKLGLLTSKFLKY